MERWTLAWILAHVSALLCLLWHPVFSLFMVLNFVTYVWYSTGKNRPAEVTWLHGYCAKMNRAIMCCLRKLVPLKAELGFFLIIFPGSFFWQRVLWELAITLIKNSYLFAGAGSLFLCCNIAQIVRFGFFYLICYFKEMSSLC